MSADDTIEVDASNPPDVPIEDGTVFTGGAITARPTYVDGDPNFTVLNLPDGPHDVVKRTKSTIDPITGEIPYDETVSLERDNDQRVLGANVSLSRALNLLATLGAAWMAGGVRLILSDGTYISFDSSASATTFLSFSQEIATPSFIQQNEGFSATGYVPKENGAISPTSGVTIGFGVDLGGKTETSLLSDGVPQSIADILAPYTQLKGQDAQNKLDQSPLTLTTDQANTVSEVYMNLIGSQVGQDYNAASSSSFSSLPKGTRSAVVDLAYQYGTGLSTATPSFWGDITSQNWASAVSELNNFHDSYPTRRQSEANLIQADINDGLLK